LKEPVVIVRIPGYRNPLSGKAAINIRTGEIFIAAEVHGRQERYLLWHERAHLRIHRRHGRMLWETLTHTLFDWMSSVFYPAFFLWGSR
jgi:hypothetical protein